MGNESADGLLGFDFLAGALVDVDLDHSQLSLYDRLSPAGNESKGFVVTPDLSDGTPETDPGPAGRQVRFAGPPRQRDAGYDPRFAVVLQEAPEPGDAEEAVAGIGGVEYVMCGNLDRIEIGPIVYQSPGMCYSQTLDADGTLLGYDLLKNFNMTFDYVDAKIVLEKRKNP